MEQAHDEFVFDSLFVKGFNQGYILAEHTPELVKTLLKSQLPENEYISGFKAGKGQLIHDRMKGMAKDIMPPTRHGDRSKGRDRDK